MIQLCCVLVDDAWKPVNSPFSVTISEEAFIHKLADAIQDHITPPERQTELICWKLTPSIGISSISGELCSFDFDLKGPHERNGKASTLRELSRVLAYFTPTELKEDHVHVLVSYETDEG